LLPETFLVRHPVLRKGKLLESCHFEGDAIETTHYFGSNLNQKLAGFISLFKKNNSDFLEIIQYLIRKIAVLENHQKTAFRKALILQSEEYLKKLKCRFNMV
jgi:hypothetical protein